MGKKTGLRKVGSSKASKAYAAKYEGSGRLASKKPAKKPSVLRAAFNAIEG